MKTKPFPLTFRAEEVKATLDHIAAGNSCSIVGIGSVGKSNLLRFLQRKDVRQAYLGDDWASFLLTYVDTNKMLRQSAWGLMELMLHQLLIELTHQQADDETLQAIDDLHRRATERKTRFLTLRYLDRALNLVCNRLGYRPVFLIDEFDGVCRTMPRRGFAALRALRDEYKYRLTYVVATRLALKRLRDDASEIEAFEELTSPHTIWLGPYSDADARVMLQRLEGRHDVTVDDPARQTMLEVTGGHPGLLREAFQAALEDPADLVERLAGRSAVRDECQRIWLSLIPEERQVMIGLANQFELRPDQSSAEKQLRRKGLVGGPWADTTQIFSRQFAHYIRRHAPDVERGVYVDDERRTVWINGHEVQGLAPLEYELIAFLAQRRDQTCSRDEVAQHLYPDEMKFEGSGVTDTRLDSVVKRARKQIEPNPKEPRYIVTVRGYGFRWGE